MNDAVENVLFAMLRERGLQATEAAQAAFLTNLREDAARAALDGLADRGDVMRITRPDAYVEAGAAREMLTRALDALAGSEIAQPWAIGQTSLALSRTLSVSEPLLIRVLGAHADDGGIAFSDGYYATPAYTPTLTPEQMAFFESVLHDDSSQPFLPTAFVDIVTAMKAASINGLSQAFDTLIARGALNRVGDDVYRGGQIAAIQTRTIEYLQSAGRMTMADFRTLLGTSRKYAVPLLEWFDGRGITLRDGDYRQLRSESEQRDCR